MSKFPTKRIFLLAISVMVIATLMAGTVFAASTTKSLSTNFTLVNLGATDATVNVSYLLPDGSAWPGVASTSQSFTLTANGGQNQIRQYTEANMASGSGSAVVSSSQPLGAIVQIQARNQTASNGAYKGFNSGSGTFYIPLVARHGVSASGTANSQIIVQNVGSGPVNFDVSLVPTVGFSSSFTKHVTGVAEGASYYYDLESDADTAANLKDANGWFGSAVVTATSANGSLAVVTNLFFAPDGLQTFNAFPIETLTDKWVVPIFTSKLTNGLSTVVTVQNLSGGPLTASTLTLQCKKEGETAFSYQTSNPSDIANNGGYSFNPVNKPAAEYPDNYYGACVVTAPAGKKIATFVQMRYVNVPQVYTAAYEGIPANDPSTSIFVPLIAAHLDNGFATVTNIANLADTDNTVTLVYTPSKECTVVGCDKNGDGKLDALDAITIPNVPIAANGGNQRNLRDRKSVV